MDASKIKQYREVRDQGTFKLNVNVTFHFIMRLVFESSMDAPLISYNIPQSFYFLQVFLGSL